MSTAFIHPDQDRVEARRVAGETSGIQIALRVLRRRGWLLCLCVLLSLSAGVAVLASSPKKYSTSAALLFQDSQLSQALFGNYATSSEEDPTAIQATNLELASQPGIAARTAQDLGSPYTAAAIGDAVKVTASGSSDLVQVTATAASPRAAEAIANAYAHATVAYQVAIQRQQIDQAAKNLSAQIAAQPAGSSLERSQLENRLSQLNAISALQTGNVQITAGAGVPTAPSSPSKGKDLGLAIVLGLLIGAIAMIVAERVDSTIKDPTDIAEIVDLPVLGSVPSIRKFGRSSARSKLDVLGDPVISESFALLVAQLQYFNVDTDVRSIVVASSGSGEGKSTVAWGLAALAAQTRPDDRVLLVDADLRRPTQPQLTGVLPGPGLAEAVVHESGDLSEFIREVPLELPDGSKSGTLHVMTSGLPVPNPAEILSSEAFGRTLAALEERYSLVVIDASPTGVVSDAIPLLSQASGVLVVSRIGVTTRPGLRKLAEQLTELRVPVFGVVHNAITRRGRDAYQSRYYARV